MRNKIALALGAVLITLGVTLQARADKPVLPKAFVYDLAATSNANVLTSSLTTSQGTSALRITIGLTGTDSIVELRTIRNSDSVTIDFDLNDGTALTAGRIYTFTVGAANAASFNIQCETTTRVGVLIIDEVQDGSL